MSNRILPVVALLAATLLVAVALPTAARAQVIVCTERTIDEAVDASLVVFRGLALGSEALPGSDPALRYSRTGFVPLEVWKGPVYDSFEVVHLSTTSEGIEFEEGVEYIVFATRDLFQSGNDFMSPACSETAAFSSELSASIDEAAGEPIWSEGDEDPFLRGDANGDDRVDMSDALAMLTQQFSGETAHCEDAADANDDGELDVTDPIITLTFLFEGGVPPAAPYPEPGVDPTIDALRCGGDEGEEEEEESNPA